MGSIIVITGCVYSGKTNELIRRVTQLKLVNRKVQAFRVDPGKFKNNSNQIQSHDGLIIPAIDIESEIDLINNLKKNTEVIAIDESQFLSETIINLVSDFANQNFTIICSGLDQDFQGNPFGSMPSLLAIADSIVKLSAICIFCGKKATKSQRKIGDNYIFDNSPKILRGKNVNHLPICRRCQNALITRTN